MTNPPPDQGIPILTEVIGPQPGPAADVRAAPIPARPAPPSFTPAPAPSPLAASPVLTPAPSTPAAARPSPSPGAAPAADAAAPPAASAVASFDTGTRALNSAQTMPRADAAAPPSAETPAAHEAGAWSDSELRDLESELRLRITRQVLGRIDFVLDHRVRNTLTEIVDTAIDALAVEIKRGLHETVTDMVSRAVAQEITRLQSAKNK